MLQYGSTVGALNAESPQIIVAHETKMQFGRETSVLGKELHHIMRKATYISDGFRMRASPLGP